MADAGVRRAGHGEGDVGYYLFVQLWPIAFAFAIVGITATAIRLLWRRNKTFGER